MFELSFSIRIIRATSAYAKQPEIGKIASFTDGRVICKLVICVEALRKEQRGVYCYVQSLPEDVEVEREYDKQLCNHIKGQRTSAFASKTVLSTWYTYILVVTYTYFFSTLVSKSWIIIMIYSCSQYSRIFDYSWHG